MRKKLQNITSKVWSITALAVILVVWEAVSVLGIVPSYMLPSPVAVCQAFINSHGGYRTSFGTMVWIRDAAKGDFDCHCDIFSNHCGASERLPVGGQGCR